MGGGGRGVWGYYGNYGPEKSVAQVQRGNVPNPLKEIRGFISRAGLWGKL